MTTPTMPTDLSPGTITTLGALRPGDVGELVASDGDGELFVVLDVHPTHEATRIHKVTDHSPYWADWNGKIVRRLGRGRLESARIVMDGEVGLAQNGLLDWHPLSVGLQGVWATTDFATFEVSSNPHSWGWEVETINKVESGECENLEDGKAKVEQWYRDRLAAALEPIIQTEAHHADN